MFNFKNLSFFSLKLLIYLVEFILLNFYSNSVFAECNCGSTNSDAPCEGTTISATVTNTGVNGADKPATFTWNFISGGNNVRCGQFANGDYWVSPAIGQTEVTVTSVNGSGSITVDADPLPGRFGLLSGEKSYRGYDVAEKLTFPSSYSLTTSLVAAIQRDEADPFVDECGTKSIRGECVDAYHVITILPFIPENSGAFMIRPNITGTTKEFLTLADFDLERLPSKSFLFGTNSAGLEAIRQRWSHSIEIFGLGFSEDGGNTMQSNSEAGRAFRSHILIDDYGAGTAKSFHNDLAILFSEHNAVNEKIAAIAAVLAYGLDLYHAKYDSLQPFITKWGTGAGQHLGKFTPVVFLASLEKNNPTRLINVKSEASVANSLQPQELAQLHVGQNGPVWGDYEGVTRYWNDLVWAQCYDNATGLCNANVGKKTAADPYEYIDGPANKPGSGYFSIGYAGILNFSAIMLMMPEFYEAVNTTRTIDFVNRARTRGLKTIPDPCVTPDTREKNTCDIWANGAGCAYYYPTATISPTWGPKSLVDKNAGCVSSETILYTKAGRFASLDGKPAPISKSYISGQLYNNWNTIFATTRGASVSRPTASILD